MSMAQTPDLDATWGSSFLPLHQPLLQMPFARQRAMRLGSPGLNNNIPPHLEHRFTSEQLQSLFQQFPASYAALTSNQKQQRSKTTTSTTTTVPTTTTTPTPTTTTPGQSMQHRRRRPPHSNEVPIFHYGGIEGREDYAVGPAEDDAVVLLVGLFNLLAIVVYAASKFVMGAQGSLSDRVIQWQVQKVLDELVIKVHSSQYMANLLSRAMPNDAVSLQQGRRVGGQAMASWKDLLQQKLRMLLLQNTSTETTEWFSAVKEQLMWEIGSSPAAMSTVRLHPYIYKPLKQIYKALTSEDGQKQFLEFISRGTESGRSLPAMKNNISWLLDTLTDLKFNPIRSIMAQEPSQQRINITAMPTAAMRSQSWLDENQDTEPSSDMDTAKVMSHVDSFVQILANYVAESFNQPKQRLNDEVTEKEHLTPFSRNFENESWDTANKRDYDSEKNIKETHNRTVEPSSSTLLPLRRSSSSSSSSSLSQLAKRQVAVDNSPWAERNNGHWTDRWFSLVTQLSPVGLDITTLYARARARPKCFRALLCRANNAWRQVGPVQAALTPFTRTSEANRCSQNFHFSSSVI